jgi:hypothetical protein
MVGWVGGDRVAVIEQEWWQSKVESKAVRMV